MERWAKESEGGYVVKGYGDGLLMIKATNGRSGRCLFFTLDEEDPTLAIALLGYKKESDEAPKNLVAAARERRGRYVRSRGGR